MQSVKEHKDAIKIGVNVIATVEYNHPGLPRVTRIGSVVKVQGKEFVIQYSRQPHDRFWLRFPLVREVG